jgi:hypothetical protein
MSPPTFVASQALRDGYRRFIDSCAQEGEEKFRLTPRADASPYALCFAIYGLKLLGDEASIAAHRDTWHAALHAGLEQVRTKRAAQGVLSRDKPYLQLLAFTLSALAALGTLERDPLAQHVIPLLPADLESELQASGVFNGLARTGNHAMFLGILLIHAGRYLGHDTQAQVDLWVASHRRHINRFGFWGGAASMSHLQFQNGYHQYELFDYLNIDLPEWSTAAAQVATLADVEGHFAPYPGGGGCFDYDAVFLLTGEQLRGNPHGAILHRLANSIVSEQNADGGFGESQRVRPRSLANFAWGIRHALRGRGRARIERAQQVLTLQRPRHDRIHTHWSLYSRGWGESDLWDSWFRVMALARIEIAADPARAEHWGFIDFPGIGYHHCLRDTAE